MGEITLINHLPARLKCPGQQNWPSGAVLQARKLQAPDRQSAVEPFEQPRTAKFSSRVASSTGFNNTQYGIRLRATSAKVRSFVQGSGSRKPRYLLRVCRAIPSQQTQTASKRIRTAVNRTLPKGL